jgi:hypothetical protein
VRSTGVGVCGDERVFLWCLLLRFFFLPFFFLMALLLLLVYNEVPVSGVSERGQMLLIMSLFIVSFELATSALCSLCLSGG